MQDSLDFDLRTCVNVLFVLLPTCMSLRWLATSFCCEIERWRSCTDIRVFLKSVQLHASGLPNETRCQSNTAFHLPNTRCLKISICLCSYYDLYLNPHCNPDTLSVFDFQDVKATFLAKAAHAWSCSCLKPFIFPISPTAPAKDVVDTVAISEAVRPTRVEPIAIRSSAVFEAKSVSNASKTFQSGSAYIQ